MASIPKVFHSLEKREITLADYEKYITNHSYYSNIKAIQCTECGDAIIYCNGNHKAAYFKHSPTFEGHGYCSLYNEGVESKTCESLMRKKLSTEKDITLNFELIYQKGMWKSFITIPPFRLQDLETNSKNKTKIIVFENDYSSKQVIIDSNNFEVGELKKIYLSKFPEKIKIKVTGESTQRDMLYTMDGFIPRLQIYSSLILQNYIGIPNNKNINLQNIKMFACKKIGGKVYTGRHYLILSYGNYDFHVSSELKKDIEITKLDLKNDPYFNYSMYDIVFKNVTTATKEFCSDRGCDLVEKNDAVILWPPMNSIGNYKYYKKNSTKMFIVFENESKAFELCNYGISSYLYFKVENTNNNPFFVMRFRNNIKEKEFTKFDCIESEKFDLSEEVQAYLFKNNIVFEKIISKHIVMKKKNKILALKSALERNIYFRRESKLNFDIESLKNAIWYSKEYVKLRKKFFNFLLEKYKDNEFVIEYLNMCGITNRIKRVVFELLMEV